MDSVNAKRQLRKKHKRDQ